MAQPEAGMPREDTDGVVFGLRVKWKFFCLLVSSVLRGYRANCQGQEFTLLRHITEAAAWATAVGRRDTGNGTSRCLNGRKGQRSPHALSTATSRVDDGLVS